jgi:tetratricopeptide (TPR) repeat protein
LLREACGLAQANGWAVLRGGCAWRGGEHPYAPLLEAMQERLAGHSPQHSPARLRADLAGCAWLVRLLPELAELSVTLAPTWTPPAEQERRLMFAAVRRFLANVAGPAGTLLVLDDLQWAGADALDLLASLVQSASGVADSREPAGGPSAPLRVIGAYRDTEARADSPLAAVIADLGRDRLAATRRIAPLARQEALAFAEELLGDEVARDGERRADAPLAGLPGHERPRDTARRRALAERLHERAGGVPYFLVSCAQALRAHALDSSTLTPLDVGVPWDVAQSIRQRIADVPPQARELLGAAAIAGRVIPFALLVTALRQPERDLLVALDALCRARLLDGASDGVPGGAARGVYQFAHDLIRDVARAELTTAHRMALHRALAEALEGRPETDGTQGTQGTQGKGRNGQRRRAAEVAYHFLEAAERSRALPHVLLAGEQAEALYAHAEAEQHYRTAATLAHELGEHAREAEALEKLGSTVLLLGHQAEARALAERAIQRYQSLGDREGELRVLGRSLELLGPAALARAQSRADSVGEAEADGVLAASPGLAALYNGLAQVYFTGSRFPASRAAATRAEQVARAAHDDAALLQALHWRIEAAGALGEDRLQAQLDLLPLAERVGDLWVLMFTLVDIALVYLHDHGDFARAKSSLERALDAAERLGSIWSVIFTLAVWVEYHYFAGDWGQGRAIAVRAVALMRQTERAGTHTALIALGLLDLVEGRGHDAAHHLGHGLALAASEGDLAALRWGGRLLAERDLVAGDAAAALARLEPLLDRPGLQEWDVVPLLPLVAWAQLALDKDAAAAATLAASKARCGRLWRVDALRMEAMLAQKQGRWGEAEAALEETLTLCRAMPYPYAETKARYVCGQVYAANGEPGHAREQYEQALAICARLGEGLYRRRIEQALGELHGELHPD